MIGVVLDTNVLVSAFWSLRGNSYKILDMFNEDEIELYYSSPIMEEYQEVLNRAKFNFPLEEISEFLKKIKNKGILADTETSVFPMPDETDRKFYDLAKTAGAILITGNIKHYPAEKFIMTPADFIKVI